MNLSQIKITSDRVFLKENEVIDNGLICGICTELVDFPEECLTCQNIYCGECIKKWIAKKNQCPYDCPPPFKSKMPHKMLRQSLLKLKIKCVNFDLGCKKNFNIDEINTHQEDCPYIELQCKLSLLCREKGLTQFNMDNHIQNCGYLNLTCEKCKAKFLKNCEKEHDCIKTLKEKIEKLKVNQQNVENFHEKRMRDLFKRIERMGKSISNIPATNPFQGLVCKLGHNLRWNTGGNTLKCPICYKKDLNSRLTCLTCDECFCINCVQPLIIGKACPLGHELLEFNESTLNHTCDMCLKAIKIMPFWRDEYCDLDLCKNCFEVVKTDSLN